MKIMFRWLDGSYSYKIITLPTSVQESSLSTSIAPLHANITEQFVYLWLTCLFD